MRNNKEKYGPFLKAFGVIIIAAVFVGSILRSVREKIYCRMRRHELSKEEKKMPNFGEMVAAIAEKSMLILGIIAVVVGLAAVVVKNLRNPHSPVNGGKEKNPPNSLPQVVLPSVNELIAQRNRLAQNIAGVVGGEYGMLVLLDAIQKGEDDAIYRQSYRLKQSELDKYMSEYHKLLEKASLLSEKERARVIMPTEDYEQYQMLLNQKV